MVVTGASSGLGRAAAIEFARRGAHVILAGRRSAALEETARSCESAGGTALTVPTDVRLDEDVRRLVQRSSAETGGIDIWVNNAGITLFSLFECAPIEEHRKVIETNLFGAMRCAHALVPIFRAQKRGILINVGSILSQVGQPYVPSYVISKFAVAGLTEVLRTELADYPNVHVCSFLPYALNTPHFESAANHVGLEPRPIPPVYTPTEAARALVDLAERPRRQRHFPRFAALGLFLHHLVPRTVERILLHVLGSWHFSSRRVEVAPELLDAPHEPARLEGTLQPRGNFAALLRWIARHAVSILTQRAPRPAR